ncbi:hypothetical protein GLOTRDRAFT_90534 [Gloeophyllum trabeum ATCC 11539]|uniref:Zn(2)-C6 fungal-type domain-containing protein n=1 Tax=Gloeophyllum trabeum (strain ATCC 11539 / FP-39264 / Madison 617) TaxID=670483 RepID=S7QPM2_GLOTA|nr:uncharacterized protein GLOTRDRAFT_90534 [Gloeophyllum trabeum ATCC 11539]EPQ61332.1 hypothetical protein GLOTRDRAFT_90534 [Gloeophyllum trabeum ATCC 11539]
MSCEFIPPAAYDELAYPMESKYLLQAYPRNVPPPDNALGIEHAYLLPQELAYPALAAQQQYVADQFYYPPDYLSPLNMAPPPQVAYEAPLSPRSAPSYPLQLPPSLPDGNAHAQWASFDADFTFPGTSSGMRRGSLPTDQLLFAPQTQAYDPYAARQSLPPMASSSSAAAQGGMSREHWTMAGSLDPSNNMVYRSAEHPRLRTAQACEKCRTRKAKCSGEHPACGRCVSRGLICEYAPERRMRGPNKPKNKPPASTSSGSPPSSASSRRSSVVSLPDGPDASAQKKKPRPPPLNLGAASNIQQREGWAPVREEQEQLTIRPRADVPSDVGSAASRASFASDVSMGEIEYRGVLTQAYPLSSVRGGVAGLDVPSSASPMSSRFLAPNASISQGHGRSLSSGATDVTPIFLQPRAVHAQRFSVPALFHSQQSQGMGLPSPPLEYPPDGVQWTSDAPFGRAQ